MSTSKPLDWIRYIDAEVLKFEEKPQFLLPHPFNWEKLEASLREIFGASTLTLTHTVQGWMQTAEGLHIEAPQILGIEWAPIATAAYFVMQRRDLEELVVELFKSSKGSSFFFDNDSLQGFYHFFAAGLLNVLDEMAFAAPLSPRIKESNAELDEIVSHSPCFAIDINVAFEGKTLWGRLLIPAKMREECKAYFSSIASATLSFEMSEKITVDVGLEIGNTSLSSEEYEALQTGDFIILDRCYYDPEEKQGAVLLTLNQKLLFRGRFKKNEGIKLTNYPLHEEVSMSQPPFDADDEDDLFDEDDEETLDLEEDIDLDEEENTMDAHSSKEPKENAQSSSQVSIDELPIDVSVEVGKVRMSVRELSQLAPGNLIELAVSPEQGVDLIVKGRKIGHGELIRIGEVLGVRILSL